MSASDPTIIAPFLGYMLNIRALAIPEKIQYYIKMNCDLPLFYNEEESKKQGNYHSVLVMRTKSVTEIFPDS